MLVDIEGLISDPILTMIANANKNSPSVIRHEKGVYEIGHFSLEYMLPFKLSFKEKYCDLDIYNSYGVCDHYKQVLERITELQNPDRFFIMSVTPVLKANQSPEGGWRWHKWGPYIGTKTPTCEYLYDEPEIDQVYVYHILEMGSSHLDKDDLEID